MFFFSIDVVVRVYNIRSSNLCYSFGYEIDFVIRFSRKTKFDNFLVGMDFYAVLMQIRNEDDKVFFFSLQNISSKQYSTYKKKLPTPYCLLRKGVERDLVHLH